MKFPEKLLKPAQGTVGQAQRAEAENEVVGLLSDLRKSADELRAGLALSVNGIALTASEAKPLTPGISPFRVATSTVRLIGWSLENTTTTALVVRFRANVVGAPVAEGDVVASVRLDAGATSSMRVGTTAGVQAEGLVVEIAPVAGGSAFATTPVVIGSVHLGRVD